MSLRQAALCGLLCACAAVSLPRASLAQMSLDIAQYAPDAPISGRAEIGALGFGEGRMRFPLTVDLPLLWPELDSAAQARGNLSGSDIGFFWLGPTRITSMDDTGITLTSRGRLQTQISAKIFGRTLTETLRDTRGFDLRIEPVWDPQTRALQLNARITDIHDLPGWARDILVDLAEPFAQTVPLFSAQGGDLAPLDLHVSDLTWAEAGTAPPETALTQTAIPNAAAPNDTPAAQGLSLTANISVDAAAGRTQIFKLLYNR